MKKILSFIFICLLLGCFVACGPQDTNAIETSTSSTETIPAETSTTTETIEETTTTVCTNHYWKVLGKKNGTCATGGWTQYACIYCDVRYTHYFTPEHEWILKPGKEPSCFVNGYKEYYQCKNCSCIKDKVTIPAQHSWIEVVVQEPTSCSEKGYIKKECGICGIKSTEELPPLEHELTLISAKESTCEEYGYTEHYACKNCNYTKGYKKIDKSHNFIFIEENSSFSIYKCSNCGCGLMQIKKD